MWPHCLRNTVFFLFIGAELKICQFCTIHPRGPAAGTGASSPLPFHTAGATSTRPEPGRRCLTCSFLPAVPDGRLTEFSRGCSARLEERGPPGPRRENLVKVASHLKPDDKLDVFPAKKENSNQASQQGRTLRGRHTGGPTTYQSCLTGQTRPGPEPCLLHCGTKWALGQRLPVSGKHWGCP